ASPGGTDPGIVGTASCPPLPRHSNEQRAVSVAPHPCPSPIGRGVRSVKRGSFCRLSLWERPTRESAPSEGRSGHQYLECLVIPIVSKVSDEVDRRPREGGDPFCIKKMDSRLRGKDGLSVTRLRNWQ